MGWVVTSMTDVTVDELVSEWGKGMRGATDKMKRGAARVKTAPSASAIAKKEKLKARLIEAIDDGTWETQLGKYTLAQWIKDFTETGVGRISSGVEKAEPKMRDFATWLLDTITRAQSEVERLPDVTDEDAVNRAVAYIRFMQKQKYKKR